MMRPASTPTVTPTPPARTLYSAPSMTDIVTSPRLFRPRARITARRGRRSSASINTRFTTRAMPAATMSALSPTSMARENSVLFSACSISMAFTSRILRRFPPSWRTSALRAGSARRPDVTPSSRPPFAEIRTMSISSVPTMRCAVSSGANTAARSPYAPGPTERATPATVTSTGRATPACSTDIRRWSPNRAPSASARCRETRTVPGARSVPNVRVPSASTYGPNGRWVSGSNPITRTAGSP
jgi:hypothetical protein